MVLLLLLILLLLVPAPAALAEHVYCGSVITADTTLDSDVVCEGETYGVTAITIAADGVTLDLAGHMVSGQPAYDGSSNGIRTDGPRTGVTVRRGSVVGFGAGLYISASSSLVERLRIRDSGGVGLQIEGNGNTVQRLDVHHFSEFGITVRGGHTVLDRNRVAGMITCFRAAGEAPRLTRNLLADCYSAGWIEKYTAATVERNTVTRNAGGFGVTGEGALVRRNDFSGNDVNGLTVVDPRAVIDRNVANDNAYDTDSPPQGGIEVFTAGTVVRHNRAYRNADYGIYAVPGVVDGGGNRARDNGNALQCLNVACRR